jgi:two-component system LytT family response regulator
MKQLTTVLVDDEPLARKGLAIRLAAHSELTVVAQCENGIQALEAIKQYQPDVLLLDVQMPVKNGFDVVQDIISHNLPMPLIVFVTAFDHYALKAFEVHAIDYLLKPADEDRISTMVAKLVKAYQLQQANAQQQKLMQLVSDVTGHNFQQIAESIDNDELPSNTKYSDTLIIKDAGELTRVPTKSIIWIDAAGDYMCVHTEKQTHILRETMKNLEQMLDPQQFVRSHRSVIVNRHHIEKFCNQLNGEYFLVLKNGKELKVSRSYKDKVKQAIIAL